MAVFHTVFDLELFGHLPPGTAFAPPWNWLSTATAASFLFLSGLSLWLAHGRGIRWRAFGGRLARIGAAAALVSAGTWAADPRTFVFFGILHAIAMFSLLGLAVLRWPVALLLPLAALLLTGASYLVHPVFDQPLLLWTGLSPRIPLTVDFEPLFPWGAAFVAGIAAARLLPAALRRKSAPRTRPARVLCWAGRHSLLIYLAHQPILIALVWAGTQALR
jgi:uncharacterized membrane protein